MKGLQMDPKHVEAWWRNKVKKIVHRVGLLYKYKGTFFRIAFHEEAFIRYRL
jgi:hypothetical protein